MTRINSFTRGWLLILTVDLFVWIFVAAIVCGCQVYWHDYDNPCTKGIYYDSLECNQWQQNYPNEYNKYKQRVADSTQLNQFK